MQKIKKEAEKLERQMWLDFDNGMKPIEANSLFSVAFDSYVEEKKDTISPVTLKAWNDTAKAIEKYFDNVKLKDFTTSKWNQFAHQYVSEHGSTVSKTSVIATWLIHKNHFLSTLVGTAIPKNPMPEHALKVFFRKSDFTVSQKQYLFSKDELNSIKEKAKND